MNYTVHMFNLTSRLYTGSRELPYIPMDGTLIAPPPMSDDYRVKFDVNSNSWVLEPKLPVLPITSVVVEGAVQTSYGVYWVPRDKVWRLTADIQLPAEYAGAQLMVIIERIRRDDANQVVVIDDIRPIATVSYDADRDVCVLTLIAAFENYGNYRIDPVRLNIGLENANKPFRLSFTPVEFDSHAQTPVFVPDNA